MNERFHGKKSEISGGCRDRISAHLYGQGAFEKAERLVLQVVDVGRGASAGRDRDL
jgi:hypothetical protein